MTGGGSLAKTKLYCAPCDRVIKSALSSSATCVCGGPMQDMGPAWKPGRKGTRTRMFDVRKAPRLYFGYRQLPFEPPRRAGRKRARADAAEAPPIRDKYGRMPWAWYVKHQDDRAGRWWR